MDELNSAIQRLSEGFVEFNGNNIAEVETAVGNAVVLYQQLIADAAASWNEASPSMQANMVGLIEQAQAAMQEQVGVFREAGGYIPTELAQGANEYAYVLPESIQKIVDQAAQYASANGTPFLNSGQTWDFLMAAGIVSNGQTVSDATQQVADQAAESGKQTSNQGGNETGQGFGSGYESGVTSSGPGMAQSTTAAVSNATSGAQGVAASGGQQVGYTIGTNTDGSLKISASSMPSTMKGVVGDTISAGDSAASGAGTVGETAVNSAAGAITSSSGLLSTAFSWND